MRIEDCLTSGIIQGKRRVPRIIEKMDVLGRSTDQVRKGTRKKLNSTNSPRFFDKALEIASTFIEPISPKASMSSMCLVISWRLLI